MTDDLDQLKAALTTATPTPDSNARDKALALAQKNFDNPARGNTLCPFRKIRRAANK